jgi:hypothetical protein
MPALVILEDHGVEEFDQEEEEDDEDEDDDNDDDLDT